MKPSGPMSAVGIPAAQYSPSMQGTVLGVDDEQANLDSLERIFAREGWRFLRAGTGPAALELLRDEPVDVVLTDLMMPGMSGQELLRAVRALALQEHSPRSAGPFVPINCAAIPETILESELFGYERGAFTGAVQRKEGRMERAQGGTLFLDEVGELTPAVQVKLLRFLQEGEIERLGGTGAIKIDCRVVAATNQDLQQRVREGRFRDDLFYRLNVIQVTLPPLRDRIEDIPLLADHFIARYAAKNGKSIRGLTRPALDALEAYPWPGNVRELEHAVERAVVLSRGDEIGPDDLPESVRSSQAARAARLPST